MRISFSGLRVPLLLAFAALMFTLDVQTVYAQSAQCNQLNGALRQFDRNGDFRQRGGNSSAAQQLQRDVQNAESQYIREGCNDAARAGQVLTRQCQQIGRTVLRLREDYAQVSQSVDTANAVAQQREAILQEMARFGCNGGSSATFSQDRQSIFDRVFGSTTEGDFTNGDFIDGGDYWGNQGYNTVRTVCVRLSDGYFWPISYSTLTEYVGNDAQQCQAMCPNTQVDLYYYDNPGQEPEQMRNMSGSAYTSLPTAFAYRTNFDIKATCKVAPQSAGTVSVATDAGGSGRTMLDINGLKFPMPLRDPRGSVPTQQAVAPAPVEAVASVALINVPLPRPRPSGPGEVAVRPNANQTAEEAELRIVHFDGKAVRVVGPDTPYAQAGQAGT
ncbi:DUF2865 domain-containing protein [Devosia sp. Leaf420]|uniref:DUF2865 domain-containing protein n=1 Tax=Devosia sp. Leaf420 TaxID=1736374 RepID=UPI00078650BE|nr:DUF2865 domain-containing protein [Devosia sp. Leaf420]